MTLNIIGIGLNDEKDVTIKGIELIKKSDFVFLENYTSILQVSKETLESYYGKDIILADRQKVEQHEDIIEKAKLQTVSLLIVGDIFSATTHYDIYSRAKKEKIEVNLVHNASVLNAIGATGLMLYNFGKTTSIPFPQDNFKPETAYNVYKQNEESGLHTLILLDLKPELNKFMTVQEGLAIMQEIATKRSESFEPMVLGCARVGGDSVIKYGTPKDLASFEFGKPLHCIIIPGKLHFVEEEALAAWK